MTDKVKELTMEERQMLNKVFWRSHLVFVSFNMVKMEANGFTLTMSPVIEKVYKDNPEERIKAYKRHQNFFNTHAVPFSFIAGISAAMEKQKAETGKIDGKTIESVKTALMGPTAGMFDSIFFNLIRIVAAGIGIGLASQGNWIGVLIFILLYGVLQSVAKRYLVFAGYKLGGNFIEQIYESGLIKPLTKASSILAIIMVGAMTAQMVNVPLDWTLTVGEASVSVNEVLDQIFPGLLSVVLMYILVKLIYKGVRPTYLVIGIIVLSLLLAALGLF